MLNFIYVTCLFMMTISPKPGSNAYLIIQKLLLNYNYTLNHEIYIDMEYNIKLSNSLFIFDQRTLLTLITTLIINITGRQVKIEGYTSCLYPCLSDADKVQKIMLLRIYLSCFENIKSNLIL